jgi:hypothetical protein
MALDLSNVTRAEMKIDRLELADDVTVGFVKTTGSGYSIIHTLTQADDWSLTGIANLYINVSFVRFLVMDFTGFEDILAQSEMIYFENILYRFERKHRPIGVTRVWEFKLEPISEFPITIP